MEAITGTVMEHILVEVMQMMLDYISFSIVHSWTPDVLIQLKWISKL